MDSIIIYSLAGQSRGVVQSVLFVSFVRRYEVAAECQRTKRNKTSSIVLVCSFTCFSMFSSSSNDVIKMSRYSQRRFISPI